MKVREKTNEIKLVILSIIFEIYIDKTGKQEVSVIEEMEKRFTFKNV